MLKFAKFHSVHEKNHFLSADHLRANLESICGQGDHFRGAFAGCSMADSQVQKAIVSLVALKKRKRLSQFRDKTRSSLAPLLHALKRRQYALLQAILGCLNPPRLREVLDASIFLKYFHCFLLCHSHFFYVFLFPFCTFVSVFSLC